MRQVSGNRPGNKSGNKNAIHTVDLFDQPKPTCYADLGYTMSVPTPLQDPCAYAVSAPSENPKQRANRITITLGPTYSETEYLRNQNKPFIRKSVSVDPCAAVVQKHDVEGYKQRMTVAGIPVLNYRTDKQKLQEQTGDATMTDSTSKIDISNTNITNSIHNNHSENEYYATSTPVRRCLDSTRGSSSSKRRRAPGVMEGDVSMDTVHAVLRLVDESLLFTPERVADDTPKVLRAAPVPSPRSLGPTFAYESTRTSFDHAGGLSRLSSSGSKAMPFGVTRI